MRGRRAGNVSCRSNGGDAIVCRAVGKNVYLAYGCEMPTRPFSDMATRIFPGKSQPVLSRIKTAVDNLSLKLSGFAASNGYPDGGQININRKAPHRWQDREQLAVSILDSLPDPALILDDAAILLQGNAQAGEVLGGLRIGEHISRTTRNPELAAAIANARQPGSRELFELVLHSPIERRLEGVATRLATNAKAANAATVLVILQDLSERDALSRMRVEFVANASHELRTPLAALTGFIETLAGPAKSDVAAQQRFLAIMAEQAARMSRLVDDLLALSRVEMRAHLAPTTIADLNHVAASAIELVKPEAIKNAISLILQPLATAARIRGDHDELVQAVQNLVHNAIKYGRPAGTIVVSVADADNRDELHSFLKLSVADDGPGIAPEHVPRLTERFYRVSTAASHETGGTGLGLAIVKHIVTRHHGTIDIASKVGAGATFTLRFPSL